MNHHDRINNARGQAVVLLLAVLTFLCAGAGLGFWIGRYADLRAGAGGPQPDPVAAHASAPVMLDAAPRPDADVDAIAVRLGQMQAELLRLNALGERLVRMSGLDPEEFDFIHPPPQGGPELGPVRDYTIKELASELSGVIDLIQDRQRKLDIIKDVIVNRDLTAQSLPSTWPVRSGYISSRFGFRIHPTRKGRIFHEGVDISSPRGSPIMAVADGVVTFSGRRNGYGRVVDILHGNGLVTRYAHNTANLVEEGQMVRQGQEIATVGSSGTATGPHVHFEVLKDDRALDPIPYLDDAPVSTLAGNTRRTPG